MSLISCLPEKLDGARDDISGQYHPRRKGELAGGGNSLQRESERTWGRGEQVLPLWGAGVSAAVGTRGLAGSRRRGVRTRAGPARRLGTRSPSCWNRGQGQSSLLTPGRTAEGTMAPSWPRKAGSPRAPCGHGHATWLTRAGREAEHTGQTLPFQTGTDRSPHFPRGLDGPLSTNLCLRSKSIADNPPARMTVGTCSLLDASLE